mgnify:CR=1 FL=1
MSIVAPFSLSVGDAGTLREFLVAKLGELRREIARTDSPRFRDRLYQVEGMLQRLLAQLPRDVLVTSEA